MVIAILGLLATVGLASFRSSQIKGRDAQRKSDLGQIQKALEMYYNDTGSYPDSLPEAGQAWENPDEEETIYMKEFPQDSRFGVYGYNSDGAQYALCARLENEQDAKIGSCPEVIDCDNEDCNYGVTSSNYIP